MKLKGEIVSARMQKTVIVAVNRLRKHAKYRKYIRITKRYKAHVDNGGYKQGDKVAIRSTRPLSKNKKWVVESKI